MVEQMIFKMQLIASVHKTLLENVEQAQKRQKKVYAARKGLQTFEGFAENAKVKMCRPGKNRSLFNNWEGPYFFVEYKDGKGFQEQNHGNKMCMLLKSRVCVLFIYGFCCLAFQEQIPRFWELLRIIAIH